MQSASHLSHAFSIPSCWLVRFGAKGIGRPAPAHGDVEDAKVVPVPLRASLPVGRSRPIASGPAGRPFPPVGWSQLSAP